MTTARERAEVALGEHFAAHGRNSLDDPAQCVVALESAGLVIVDRAQLRRVRGGEKYMVKRDRRHVKAGSVVDSLLPTDKELCIWAREALGKNQYEMADFLGTSRSTISHVETGRYLFSKAFTERSRMRSKCINYFTTLEGAAPVVKEETQVSEETKDTTISPSDVFTRNLVAATALIEYIMQKEGIGLEKVIGRLDGLGFHVEYTFKEVGKVNAKTGKKRRVLDRVVGFKLPSERQTKHYSIKQNFAHVRHMAVYQAHFRGEGALLPSSKRVKTRGKLSKETSQVELKLGKPVAVAGVDMAVPSSDQTVRAVVGATVRIISQGTAPAVQAQAPAPVPVPVPVPPMNMQPQVPQATWPQMPQVQPQPQEASAPRPTPGRFMLQQHEEAHRSALTDFLGKAELSMLREICCALLRAEERELMKFRKILELEESYPRLHDSGEIGHGG